VLNLELGHRLRYSMTTATLNYLCGTSCFGKSERVKARWLCGFDALVYTVPMGNLWAIIIILISYRSCMLQSSAVVEL
jgi:hypothetical protein